jgi:hypothetical protein
LAVYGLSDCTHADFHPPAVPLPRHLGKTLNDHRTQGEGFAWSRLQPAVLPMLSDRLKAKGRLAGLTARSFCREPVMGKDAGEPGLYSSCNQLPVGQFFPLLLRLRTAEICFASAQPWARTRAQFHFLGGAVPLRSKTSFWIEAASRGRKLSCPSLASRRLGRSHLPNISPMGE